MNFLTKSDEEGDPGKTLTTSITNDWRLCYRSETALGDDYWVECKLGGSKVKPVIRQFAVLSEEYDGKRPAVSLREVRFYGSGK